MRVYAIGEKVEISLLKTIGEIVEVRIISNNSNIKYNVMYVVNNDVYFCDFWDWQLKLINGHSWGEYEIGFIKMS